MTRFLGALESELLSRLPCAAPFVQSAPALLPAEILNPIEQFLAKLKHWLRIAEKRTTDAVFDALGPILDTPYRTSAPIISPTPDMTKRNLIPL